MSTQLPPLTFAGLDDFTPWQGAQHSLLPFEGEVAVKIIAAAPETAQNDPTKGFVKVTLQCTDDDVQGQKLTNRVMYAGRDKNGDPLVRQFAQMCESSGTPVEKIREFAASGATLDIAAQVKGLIGRTAYITVKRGEYNGRDTTDVSGFIPKSYYEDQKASGAWRRTPVRPASQAMVAGTVTIPNLGGPANGATQAGAGATQIPAL